MKYWEIIVNKLTASGWSWGIARVIDGNAGELFIVDAYRSDKCGRFIVQCDELLTAFLEVERQATADEG